MPAVRRNRPRWQASMLVAFALCCCGPGDGSESSAPSPSAAPSTATTPSASPSPTASPTPAATPTGRFQPQVGITWEWQLQGNVDTSYNVSVYDIDLFDVPESTYAQLQMRGIHVLCYFSAGTYENFRSDLGSLPSAVLGNQVEGWPGERWLDIRATSVREVMKKRLDLARSKGCDGVEPDNVDGYANKPGFPVTASDQLDFNRFLSSEAHARGLAIALKNDLEQVSQLVDDFDLAVNEQCFEFAECDALKPFIDANKPVLNAEYQSIFRTHASARNALCQNSLARGFTTLVLSVDLDNSFRFSCR